MRPISTALPVAAVLLLAVVLPASAVAGSWTAPRAATSAGDAFGPTVAADARGRLAVGWVRRLGDRRRAEVRRGTLRDGPQGGALVLDSTTSNLDSVTVGLSAPDGLLTVAWRRLLDAAQRLRGATVTLAGAVRGPVALTPAGPQSAYAPRFVTGADLVQRLVWDRRTTSAGRLVQGGTFGASFAVPGTGVSSTPGVAADADGTLVAVWTEGGRLLAAHAPAGGPFGAPVVLSTGGYAREPQVTVAADGDVVAAWLSSTGQGNAVLAAVRPRGGAFGAPYEVVPATQRAFAPRLAATSAGEVLVAFVNSATTRGFGSARGVVRLQRLGGDERPVGGRIRLSPDGARAIEPALAHDGVGSVIAGWTDSAAGLRVQLRRIAPGGLTGPVRTLSRGRADTTLAPELAGGAGRAAATWVSGGDVRVSLYR